MGLTGEKCWKKIREWGKISEDELIKKITPILIKMGEYQLTKLTEIITISEDPEELKKYKSVFEALVKEENDRERKVYIKEYIIKWIENRISSSVNVAKIFKRT